MKRRREERRGHVTERSTERAGTAHFPTIKYGSASIACNRVAPRGREFIDGALAAGTRKDSLSMLRAARNLLSPSQFCPWIAFVARPSRFVGPDFSSRSSLCNHPLRDSIAALLLDSVAALCALVAPLPIARVPVVRAATLRHSGKRATRVYQRLKVLQRGHLRRRAFCAALVFAFSLWRV